MGAWIKWGQMHPKANSHPVGTNSVTGQEHRLGLQAVGFGTRGTGSPNQNGIAMAITSS